MPCHQRGEIPSPLATGSFAPCSLPAMAVEHRRCNHRQASPSGAGHQLSERLDATGRRRSLHDSRAKPRLLAIVPCRLGCRQLGCGRDFDSAGRVRLARLRPLHRRSERLDHRKAVAAAIFAPGGRGRNPRAAYAGALDTGRFGKIPRGATGGVDSAVGSLVM